MVQARNGESKKKGKINDYFFFQKEVNRKQDYK